MKKIIIITFVVLLSIVLISVSIISIHYYYNKKNYSTMEQIQELLGLKETVSSIKSINALREGDSTMVVSCFESDYDSIVKILDGTTASEVPTSAIEQIKNQIKITGYNFDDLEFLGSYYKEFHISMLYPFFSEEARPHEIWVFQNNKNSEFVVFTYIPFLVNIHL